MVIQLLFIKTFSIKGSNESAEIAGFTKSIYQFQEDKMNFTNVKFSKNASLSEKNAAQNSLDSLDVVFKQTRDDFINKNYNSICAIVAVGYLNPTEDIELLRKIEGGLAETVPNSDYHLGVKTQLTQIETQIKIQQEQEEQQHK